MNDRDSPDPSGSRFWETLLLIFGFLGLFPGVTFLILGYINRQSSFAVIGTAALCGGALFMALFKIFALTADTNEKMNRLWRDLDRFRHPPEPVPQDQRCRVEGCENRIYSTSSRLCRFHVEQKKSGETGNEK